MEPEALILDSFSTSKIPIDQAAVKVGRAPQRKPTLEQDHIPHIHPNDKHGEARRGNGTPEASSYASSSAHTFPRSESFFRQMYILFVGIDRIASEPGHVGID